MSGSIKPSASRRNWLGVLFGAMVSIVAGWLFLRSVPLASLAAALSSLHYAWIIGAFAALFADYALRSWRWMVMLREENPELGLSRVAPTFIASIALNNVLPFRFGDVARALVLPARLGITRSYAAATLVIERLLDLIFVLVLLSTGLILAHDRLPEGNHLSKVAAFGAVLSIGGVLAVGASIWLAPLLQTWLERVGSSREGAVAKVSAALAGVLRSVAMLRSIRMWIALIPASALCWLLEGLVFWTVLRGLGVASVTDAAILGSIGTLATLVPSTPGYVGTFHLAVQQAAAALGMSHAIGSSTAILAHGVLWLGTTAVGLVALFHIGLCPSAAALGATPLVELESA